MTCTGLDKTVFIFLAATETILTLSNFGLDRLQLRELLESLRSNDERMPDTLIKNVSNCFKVNAKLNFAFE